MSRGARAPRIAIVGAGLSGLTTAFELRRRGAAGRPLDVILLESGVRPGGPVRTERIDGCLVEAGPNGFLDSAPDTLTLVERLGLSDRLLRAADSARHRYILRGGRLHRVPGNPLQFLASPLLSLRGRCRVLAEPFARRRPEGDESVRAFASRRIGGEAADVLVDAMVSGIFAGDAAQLSLRACFPAMWRMETEHGSLVRALFARKRRMAPEPRTEPIAMEPRTGPMTMEPGTEAVKMEPRTEAVTMEPRTFRSGDTQAPRGSPVMPRGRLTSFEGGMQDLVDALSGACEPVLRTGVTVTSIARDTTDASGAAWHLTTAAGETITADAVVLATPSHVSARIVSTLDAVLAASLSSIPAAPLAVVALAYDKPALDHPLDGFGFLAPGMERFPALGILWDSSIYPNRAPAGQALLRVILGGARAPDIAARDDGSVTDLARDALRRGMDVSADPRWVHIVRHVPGLPQYTCGHLDRLEAIGARAAEHRGLHLTGNSYRGVAMNACIADALALADRVFSEL